MPQAALGKAAKPHVVAKKAYKPAPKPVIKPAHTIKKAPLTIKHSVAVPHPVVKHTAWKQPHVAEVTRRERIDASKYASLPSGSSGLRGARMSELTSVGPNNSFDQYTAPRERMQESAVAVQVYVCLCSCVYAYYFVSLLCLYEKYETQEMSRGSVCVHAWASA